MNNKDDERLRNATIAFLKEFADKGYENAVECIAWLEKQSEQNHSWSEEDETKLRQIEYACMKFFGGDCSHIGWLRKSLKGKYSWKPSDEQMETLEQWLRDNRYKGDARTCYPIFDSLYNDLKKVREK